MRKSPSQHSRKSTLAPKLLGTAEAYFVCHIGQIFQMSLIYEQTLKKNVDRVPELVPERVPDRVPEWVLERAPEGILELVQTFY